MKKLLVLPVILLLGAAFLFQGGCGGDGDSGTTAPQECSVTITNPLAGAEYLSGEALRVRWTKEGSETRYVIKLLKADAIIATLDTVNVGTTGTYLWSASTMGANSGSDFSVEVTALNEEGCGDTSDHFTILNTEDCNLAFTIDYDPDDDPETPFVLEAGQEFEITWTSQNTTGFVDIELLRGDLPSDEPIGYIVSSTADDGSYLWTVDSLNQGTYGFFYLRISDRDVAGCNGESLEFPMIDEDVCEIWVNQPQPGTTWNPGTNQLVVFTAPDPGTTHVNINLYEGAMFVNSIAAGVETTGLEQSVPWVVSTLGSTSPGTSYRIKVIDAADQYCVGWSGNFTIPNQD